MKTVLKKLLAVFLLIPVALMYLALLALLCWALYHLVVEELADSEYPAVFLIGTGIGFYFFVSIAYADWAFDEVVTLLPKFKRKPKGADHERK